MKNKHNKGFTLIELIVIMVVIAILVLLAIPKFMGHTEKARIIEIKSNIKQLENASERYYIDKQDWPRLNEEPYTAQKVETFAQEIKDKTGQVITLDPKGDYYDIDYNKLQKYVQKPNDGIHYILQNPIGEVFYLDALTTTGETRQVINHKPVAVISMIPNSNINTNTNITWDYSDSTDPDGNTITNIEWDGQQSVYNIGGTYTVKLRVQNSKGVWSDWTSVIFRVSVNNMEGEGTNENPYVIKTEDDLNDVRLDLNAYYILNNDITLTKWQTGQGWAPIGTTSVGFKGSFNGNAHIIKNLYINRSGWYQGLFVLVDATASVYNLGIESASINAYTQSGVLAGMNKGHIYSVYTTGSITTSTNNAGGITGVNYGVIENCYSTVSGTASQTVGGISAYVTDNATIRNCYATGNLTGMFGIGGIVGSGSDTAIIENNFGLNGGLYKSTGTDGGFGRIHGYRNDPNINAKNYGSGSMILPAGFRYGSDGIGVTLTDAKKAVTYTSKGWDFTSVWKITEGVSYPKLKWQN